jgi:hypothetical protein
MTGTVKCKMCILMDCTSSMEPWIQAAKDQIQTIVRGAQHANIEVAFVGYRDMMDEVPMIVVPFADVDSVLRSIQSVHADGGDDIAEDVYSGVFHVYDLDWTNADVRTIIHIADAPAHGITFHSIWLSDNFPSTEPGPLLDKLTQLSRMHVDYTFIRINSSTDTMLELFHNAYTGPGIFKVVDLIPQDRSRIHRTRAVDLLTPSITMSLQESITRHTSSQDPLMP